MCNVTEKLANYVESYSNLRVNSNVIHQVKRVILDYICCAISGASSPVSKLVYQTILDSEGGGNFYVIGNVKKLSKSNAAFVNGTSAHCFDLDDGHTEGSVHPGAVILPVIFAEIEQKEVNFEKLSKAIIIGYDICLRLSSAIHPTARNKGFHNTPLTGIFGAVAALSVLNDFKHWEIQNAFGIAGSFSGGIFAFLGTGSEVKRIHPGQAARDAILSIELTKKGLTGPKSVFESENGFFQAFADKDVSIDRLFQGVGEHFEIMNIYFKPYPCCRHIHSTIDAVYKIKQESHVQIERIEKIKVGVNKLAFKHKHKTFSSILDTQMSIPFSVAVALTNPSLKVSHFIPGNKKIESLANLVEVYVHQTAEDTYPTSRQAYVEIIFNDGEQISAWVDHPVGEPATPLSDERLIEKFLENTKDYVSKDKSQKIIKNILNIGNNNCFSLDLNTLFDERVNDRCLN
ncbi:MmgE/PrpD family protein [Cytobacillus kochii]|uniref:MmgE/PrpD family protein n=1 Tax=Cytobacillus kochii TaxID=859143 RepID=UPI002780D6B3|nr:MmgE/PrpD family protein [Cytobacillus kochii]MDQ0185337.1 2-methylcitrate dehydratase PrpD [Cytobacillus kochii]